MSSSAAAQDDDIAPTPEKGAAQAQAEATPPLFLPLQAELTWGPAQGRSAPSPLGYASPTAVSMEITGGSLEGSEYSAHQRGQEDTSRLLGAHMLDTAGSTGAHLV